MRIELRGIAKSFYQGQTELKIIENLDLQLAEREIVAIIGESGSGKSTLLSLLAGFESPDRGSFLWDGRNTATWGEREWSAVRKAELGMVFQNYYLIPYLTALENVQLPMQMLKALRPEEAKAFLNEVNLSDRMHHLPHQMSGGESQRVAIARALIHQPRVLLADEPTGSLDQKTGDSVLNLLFKLLRERQQTALIVTHSADVAERCDRRLIMREGRLWSA